MTRVFRLRPRMARRLLGGLVLALALAGLLLPGTASAHALLVQADPAPDSVIAHTPAVATFVFSEALNPALTRVRVTDAAGRQVTPETGHLAPGHGGTVWLLPLPRLAPGTYSVFWTSQSATDGHVRSSFYTFRVAPTGGAASAGAVGAAPASGAGLGALLDAGSAVTALFTWLGFLGQALCLGALLVEVGVLVPARRASGTAPGRLAWAAAPRLCWTVRGALVLTVGALLGEIASLAVQAAGGDWGRALAGTTLRGLFSSQNGHLLLARLTLLLAVFLFASRVGVPATAPLSTPDLQARRVPGSLGIAAPTPPTLPLMLRWEAGRIPLTLGAAAYLALVALSGHAANVTPGLLAYPIDWLHLVCTAAWAGGIAALALAVLPARHALAPDERAAAVFPLLDRFSPVAYAAVGALALSGLYNALVHVATPATLAETTYGQLLVVKLVLVGLLMLLSATHVYGLRPRMAHAHGRIGHDGQAMAVVHEGLATLAGRLRLETGVGAAILLATALMTQTLPAPRPASAAPAETPIPASISGTAPAGDLRARLTVAPPAIGTARFTLQVWEKGQAITDDTGAAIIHLFPADRPTLYTTVTPAAHGTRFSGRGSLPTAGTWRADVLVRTATVNEYRTLRFTFTVGPGAGFLEPGQAPERVSLSVSPGRLALPNTVTVSGLPARGVRLVSESLDMRMGRIPYTATPLGGGRWQVRNVYPLMNGRWGLTVQVRSGGGWVALRRFVYQVPLRGTMRLLGAGQAPAATTGATIAPRAVRWARLPYRAVVSFVDNGLVYVPGLPTLIHVGSQNHSVTQATDGTIWVMDNAGGRVAVLDPRTGHIVARISVGIAPAHAVFTPDGRRAYVSNLLSNDVSVIDVRTRRVVQTISVQPGLQPHALAVTPDGREVWVPCGLGGGIWVIDTRTNKVARTIPTGGFPHSVAFAPDGRTAYLADASPGTAANLLVIDRARGTIRAHIPVGTGSAMVVASRDGRRVYVTGQSGSVLTVIDAAARRIVARVPVGKAPHGLAFTPDGRLLYVAVNDARHVAVVDTTTDRVVATVPVPGTADELVLSAAPAARQTAVKRGGAWVATGFRRATNALLTDPRRPGLLVAGTADGAWLSPDGGATWRRAGAGLDGTAILALAAPATGRTIVAGGQDGGVYVGETQSEGSGRWRRIGSLGPDHPVFSVSISPRDGRTVLAGTFGALYRGARTGHGWAWQRVARTGEAAVTAIAWAPWDTRLAFASVFAAGPSVLVSHDAGRTWRPDGAGPPPALPTDALLAVATPTPQVYLATMGGGVWRRSAAGAWQDISAGLPARHAMQLVAAHRGTGPVLYAGSMGFGVYARQGEGRWRRLGRGLDGGAYTVLSLALTSGPQPDLVVGTVRGLFRYVPSAPRE